MPWKDCDEVDLREECVRFMDAAGANVAELCRRYGISRKTAYKWKARYAAEGRAGLMDRSRRPLQSPLKIDTPLEHRIVELRLADPHWGGRKLRKLLIRERGPKDIPSASTITEVLRRNGLLDPAEASKHCAHVRFEHPQPNDLWQMDFKGHFGLTGGGRCHPLTVLDDHSRFALGLRACSNERGETVEQELTALFRRYGLPRRMLMDNGAPWGYTAESPYTPLTVWLLQLGIAISHGRAYHPQTQGKEERFHRTLKRELLSGSEFADLQNCQSHFDPWREKYNFVRPHEALGLEVPGSRYQSSPRSFPEVLPPIEYDTADEVRKVQEGWINFHGKVFLVSQAFHGYPVGLRPTDRDGIWEVWFCQHLLGEFDERVPKEQRNRVMRKVENE